MRYLVLVFMLMLSACASTTSIQNKQSSVPNGYVRVIGTGKNLEEARQNGFQLAVEMAVGSVVVTEKQAVNNNLMRDQILKHSSGYVEDFNIVEQSGTNLRYTIVMDVKVKNSQIAEIILNTGGKKGDLNSTKIFAQYSSYNKERNDAENLIGSFINTFPKSAFDAKIKSTSVTVDKNRDMVLVISIDYTWNAKWTNALIEHLNRVKDETKTTHRKIKIVQNSEGFSMFDNVTDYYVNDEKIFKKVFEGMFTTLYPVIEVVDNRGNTIIRGCDFNYPNFNAIRTTNTHTVNARYTIPKDSQTFINMKQMDHVNAYMTSNSEVCTSKF